MPTLWAKRVSYDSIGVGDDLPILVKHETQQTIDFYARNAASGPIACPIERRHNRHIDEDYAGARASEETFGGTVSSGPATVAYVAELLEKGFPLPNLMGHGSQLEMRATRPIRPGDTITFTGMITAKREEDGNRLVDCEIIGESQDGQVVARARATISFPS